MITNNINLSIGKYNHKGIKFNYNKFSLLKKIFFIIFLIIIYLAYIKVKLFIDNNYNYYNKRGFANLKKKWNIVLIQH